MKPGPKPKTPEVKMLAGTLHVERDGGKVTITSPNAMPLLPGYVTPDGVEVWERELPRALTARGIDELDSGMFANFCNIQGEIEAAWRRGDEPSVGRLDLVRKMAEQFGLYGLRSRIVSGDSGKANAFARNGVKS